MRRLDWTSANADTRARVLRRPAQDPGRDVMPVVAEILAAVAARGDAAVVEYTRRFDAAAPTRLEVDREALALAVGRLAPPLVAAFAWNGRDTLGPLLYALFIACMLASPSRRLYATMFVLALAMELYGTWIGNWAWAPQVP